MNRAWGPGEKRNMEQFEIIDIRDEDVVRKSWSNFIHSHHYDYETSYFESSMAYNPRRTSESYFQHILPMSPDEVFSESNPVPNDFKTLEELWAWHQPLIDAENIKSLKRKFTLNRLKVTSLYLQRNIKIGIDRNTIHSTER